MDSYVAASFYLLLSSWFTFQVLFHQLLCVCNVAGMVYI